MIERIYIKDYFTFEKVELEFSNGLIVFTGASGAGKSILFKGILSIFGYFDSNASVSEAVLDNKIDLEKFGLESDDILIFRQIKKNKNRFFINNQAVSKKRIKEISSNFLDYLSIREIRELENENILNILDKIVDKKEHYSLLKEYKNKFLEYKKLNNQIEVILKEEKEVNEKKEFLKFELNKIETISPKIGEFEELMRIKKDLSKIEKIKEKTTKVEKIFDFEYDVYELFEMIGEDGEFFSNVMNELRIVIEKANEKAEFLENVNIEEVLDRLSSLQELIRRFGSIEESLRYYEEKKKELNRLENLSFEKEQLINKSKELKEELKELANKISLNRKDAAKKFEKELNYFLKKLYMKEGKISIKETKLSQSGKDKVEIVINEIDINSISTGELNRLRLAIIASKLKYEDSEKILFLDEIDANLSGEESMSVAEVLKYLSSKYQIFVISHQPQLTSKADKHFLVTKKGNKSFVKELNYKERIEEIARIIGGKEKSKKAKEYVEELLKRR